MRPLKTLRWSPEQRPFLVCVRTGTFPIAPFWITGADSRNWDLLLSYYEPPPELDRGAEMITVGGTSKFPALWETNRLHNDFLLGYRAALFLDDDVQVQFEDVDALFSLFCDFDLSLAQPALSPDSFSSWPITLRCPSFRLRFTNFVEVMAPLFSAVALSRCLETFNRSVSGWGLDLIWPMLLGNPTDRIAIIDEISVTHIRPVDLREGKFYNYLRSIGVDPYRELEQLTQEYGLTPNPEPRQYKGVPLAAAVEKAGCL